MPRLRSLVGTRQWIRLSGTQRLSMMAAGTTALERYSAIVGDRIPTYAIWQTEYRRRLGSMVADAVDTAFADLRRPMEPEPWSARPVDVMATVMSIEAAAAGMDEPNDLGSVPKYLLGP